MGSVPRQNTNSLAGRPAGSDRALAPRRAFGFSSLLRPGRWPTPGAGAWHRRLAGPWTAGGALAALTLGLAGCVKRPRFDWDPWLGADPAPIVPADPGPVAETVAAVSPFWWIPWLAGICALIGVAGLVASVWLPIIPRKTAGAAVAAAVGLGVLHWLLDRFIGWIALAAIVTAVLAALPVAIGWYRLQLQQLSKRLGTAHPDGAIALRAAAYGRTRDEDADRGWRKRQKARLLNQPTGAS